MSSTMQMLTSVPVREQYLLLLVLFCVMHYAPKWSVSRISSKKNPYAWDLPYVRMSVIEMQRIVVFTHARGTCRDV